MGRYYESEGMAYVVPVDLAGRRESRLAFVTNRAEFAKRNKNSGFHNLREWIRDGMQGACVTQNRLVWMVSEDPCE